MQRDESEPAARALFEQLEGGIQNTGRAEAPGLRFGVFVIMQLKFQQSFVVSVDVPQTQFIDRVVEGCTVQTVQKTGDSPGAVLG